MELHEISRRRGGRVEKGRGEKDSALVRDLLKVERGREGFREGTVLLGWDGALGQGVGGWEVGGKGRGDGLEMGLGMGKGKGKGRLKGGGRGGCDELGCNSVYGVDFNRQANGRRGTRKLVEERETLGEWIVITYYRITYYC